MTRLKAGIVDVFGESAFSGNPLAVVEDADALTDPTMRQISREFNQAETTFVLRSDVADWRLRSFTASGAEVFGAGHNSLGAWLWLAAEGKLGTLETARTFRQEIGNAVLPITLERRNGVCFGRMKQSPLKLLGSLDELLPLAQALGLDIVDVNPAPEPRVADTGAYHLLVRLVDRNAVDRARASAELLLPVLRAVGAEGCYIYSYESGRAYARFFNPTVGLWEDAATGTAAGPLCAYLGAKGFLGPDNALLVEQGVLMGRRSLLNVRLTPEAELSGSGVVVLRGELSLVPSGDPSQ
jgi:PhzF family phenazine biosynthesis protein